MNKIIREHYPVSRLPEDLREGLSGTETVRVVIEETSSLPVRQLSQPRRIPVEEFACLLEQTRATLRHPMSMQDAVSHIRALRDEWDDE